MSEKQFEKRSLFKASAFSRSLSSFRQFKSRTISEQERASSSVVESNINDQELQRIVRDKSSEKLINEYVRRRFQSYLDNNVENVDLWESIYYDFEYFTERIWKIISSDNWIFIKKICLTQEFWLNQADSKNSRFEIMYKVSKENYYADWTLNQIQRVEKVYERLSRDTQIRKNKLQSSSVQSFSIQLSSLSSLLASRSSSSSSSIEIYQDDSLSEIRTQYEPNTRQHRNTNIRNRDSQHEDQNRQFNLESRHEDRPFNLEPRYENRYEREPNRLRNRQYELSEYAFTKYADENLRLVNEIRRASQISINQAFESYVSSSSAKTIYEKKLSMLNKLYKNEKKFDDTEDNFDFKLTIYLDKCRHADLSKHAYEKEISAMLTDETLTRYYANKTNFITFNDFCISMQTYFENSEWQSHNLDKWHNITIEDVIAINSNVSLTECLRKMWSQMNTIQRDLNSAYHDSIRLRENIIRICKNHSALIFALINSSMNNVTLMNNLQSSIINYEIVRKSFVHQQYHQNDEIDDHYFTDKQYRRDDYDRRDESSDRRIEFYRDESRDDKSNDRFQNRRLKKCFVCDKFDCWSINHSNKKREDSKKRF